MTAALRLPDYPPNPDPRTGGTAGRGDYNRTADSQRDRELTVSALGTVAPVCYGRVRIGAIIGQVGELDGDLVLCLIWCLGEIDAIEGIYDDKGVDVSAGVTWAHYLGTASQGIDPTLAAAISGWDKTLVAPLRGETVSLAYSVARISAGYDGGLKFSAQIRGRRVFDPRGAGSTAWSDNPALIWADFETSALYGRALDVDWASVGVLADACDDEVVAGEKRRTLNLAMIRRTAASQWSETLRGYAGAFRVDEGGTIKMVADRPASASRSVVDDDVVADGNGMPQLLLSRPDLRNSPTVVRVIYTDKTGDKWRDGNAWAYAPGVLDGSTEWRETTRRMPGIDRHSQAHREAVETLNRFLLADLLCQFDTHDEAIADQTGDVITITSSRGLDNKLFRITGTTQIRDGRWRIQAAEYQPGIYSDAVENNPTWNDTNLPSPFEPPGVSGLSLAEEVYRVQVGTYASRVRVTWSGVSFPYLDRYEIEILSNGQVVFSGATRETNWATPAVQELVAYTVRVRVVTSVGAASDWASAAITPQGKYLIPGDVPSITGFEVGGEVRLSWEAAVDLDIWRYEVRYGAAGVAWGNATVIDRVDSLRLMTRDVPEGTWDFLVKAVDSVRQYSASEARVTIEVSLDASAYQADAQTFSFPYRIYVREDRIPRFGETWDQSKGEYEPTLQYCTDYYRSAESVFTGSNLAADYPGIAATYRDGNESGGWSCRSSVFDLGQVLSGNWRILKKNATTHQSLSGVSTELLKLSTDNVNWTDYPGLTAKASARYARYYMQGGTADTGLLLTPFVQCRLHIVPRTENGQATTDTNGKATILLEHDYVKVISIVVTPEGSAALTSTVDNIVLGGAAGTDAFDVYLFDGNGNLAANKPFLWQFNGV